MAIALVVLAILLSGCSPLSMLSSALSPAPAVDVQAGKTNEKTVGAKIDTGDSVEGETVTVHKAEKFANVTATELIHDERVPWWVWLMMILGWVLPSPIEIWRGLGNLMLNARDFFADKKHPSKCA